MLCGLVCVASARAQDVSLLPTSLTFSTQAIGTTSGTQTITLTNTDDANALAISSIVASGDFTKTTTCGSSVAAGGQCTITVQFAPTVAGSVDGSITIIDSAPESPQVLALKGTGTAPLTLSTPSFDFGHVTIGQTGEIKTIKLTNHTAAAIAISIQASADFAATPAASGGCGSTVAANSSCSENVVFAPTELGTISGALIFTAAGQPLYVDLVGEGEGTAGSPLTLTPASLAFGNQAVGSTSAVQSVTIQNTGSTSLSLAIAASRGYVESSPISGACGSTLAAGASCAINVQFSPAVLSYVNGGISVSYSGADSPQVVSLTGTGVAQVTASPASLTFASQQVGTKSAAKKITATNNSPSAISVSSIVPSGDFTESDTCEGSIAVGSSCTISISFAPTRGWSVLGSVSITDSATSSPQIVDLSGTSFLLTRFAYVCGTEASIYTVNLATGQLRSSGYSLTNGSCVNAIDPSGRFAYALGSSGISEFTINASTGALTPVTGSYASPAGTAPVSITIDPSDKFLYVVNQETSGIGGSVSAYTIDGGTGALTAVSGSAIATGEGPLSLVIDPTGRFAYVNNVDDSPGGDISGYTIDPTSGALTAMAGGTFLSGSGAFALAMAPSGKFGYVLQFTGEIQITTFSIDATTGIPKASGSPFNLAGSCGFSLVMAPSGDYMFIPGQNSPGTVSVVKVNATSGAVSAITSSPFAAGIFPARATVDPKGTLLYVANTGSDEIWTYSIASDGALTLANMARTMGPPGSVLLAGGTAAITYTPKFLYVANNGSNTVSGNISAYSINSKTGKITAVSGSPFADGTLSYPTAVAADPTGRFLYVANATGSVAAYTINASSGALSPIGSAIADADLPISVAVDPTGRFLYVANTTPPTISEYTIDASTGALSAISGSPISTQAQAGEQTAAIDPTGQFVYITVHPSGETSGQLLAYTIDPSSGALTDIPGSPFTTDVSYPYGAAVDPSGKFLYVSTQTNTGYIDVFAINAGSGALTYSSYASTGPYPVAVAVNPLDNYVYTPSLTGNYTNAFSVADGVLTQLTDSPFNAGENPFSVAVDPSGKFVYTANNADNDVTAYAIAKTGGDLVVITGQSAVPAGTGPIAVTTTGTFH
jgi:6-phosphogluconolactonase (cycloisomerase 2 family)